MDASIVTVVSEDDDVVLSDGDVDVSSVEEDSDDDFNESAFYDASQGQGMSRMSIKRPER